MNRFLHFWKNLFALLWWELSMRTCFDAGQPQLWSMLWILVDAARSFLMPLAKLHWLASCVRMDLSSSLVHPHAFSGMKRTIGFSRQDMPRKQQHGLCWLMCCVIDSVLQIGSIIQKSWRAEDVLSKAFHLKLQLCVWLLNTGKRKRVTLVSLRRINIVSWGFGLTSICVQTCNRSEKRLWRQGTLWIIGIRIRQEIGLDGKKTTWSRGLGDQPPNARWCFLCVDGQRLRKQNSNCMFPHWPWWKVVMKVPETHFGLWSAWMHYFNKDCSRSPRRGMWRRRCMVWQRLSPKDCCNQWMWRRTHVGRGTHVVFARKALKAFQTFVNMCRGSIRPFTLMTWNGPTLSIGRRSWASFVVLVHRLVGLWKFIYERFLFSTDAFWRVFLWKVWCIFDVLDSILFVCRKLGISYVFVSAFSGVVMEFSTQSDFQFRWSLSPTWQQWSRASSRGCLCGVCKKILEAWFEAVSVIQWSGRWRFDYAKRHCGQGFSSKDVRFAGRWKVWWTLETHRVNRCRQSRIAFVCCQSSISSWKKLLLHKAAWVGNPTTPQAVCASCKQALMATPLMMPRYSLANDLWIGRCPPALQDLEAGTQKLLPLVRTCIQVTILQGSGLHSSERQRGLIGNSIFLPQASPSQVQRVLPPSAETLQEHFSFVLVDAEKKNIDRAPLLETSHARYAAAVKCLNELSPYYQDVDVAVERLGDDGLAPALLDCVLETSAAGALAQRLLQSGPADAQGQDLEEEQEDAAPVAHVTEEGAKNEWNSRDHRVCLCVCVVCVCCFQVKF